MSESDDDQKGNNKPAASPEEPSTALDIGYLSECPNCMCRDLFIRKDFPQKVGVTLVVGAVIVFLFLAAKRSTFYVGVAILAIAALVDGILYLVVPKITVCYRCRTEFRDYAVNPKHEGFELAVAEKYRRPPTQ